ncbi:MAG TPA: hypothetical protein VFT49_02325 [Candidatus Saccharimonadales bacterium]|nr:hypothetical protein [Candidatus Saccharimonadales bacterium]
MLATFISFHPFWFGVANALIIIGLTVLTVIVAAIAFFSVGSKNGPTPFVLFALFFAAITVFLPYFRTKTREHTHLASRQMTAAYGGKVLKVHVNDHNAIMQLPGCKTPFVHEMRQFKNYHYRGGVVNGYRYAADYQITTKNGDAVTEHHPLSKQLVLQLCKTA